MTHLKQMLLTMPSGHAFIVGDLGEWLMSNACAKAVRDLMKPKELDATKS